MFVWPVNTNWPAIVFTLAEDCTVGFDQRLDRVEMSIVPGATTSGLKRPEGPSTPMPTLPREENSATWVLLSVKPLNG